MVPWWWARRISTAVCHKLRKSKCGAAYLSSRASSGGWIWVHSQKTTHCNSWSQRHCPTAINAIPGRWPKGICVSWFFPGYQEDVPPLQHMSDLKCRCRETLFFCGNYSSRATVAFISSSPWVLTLPQIRYETLNHSVQRCSLSQLPISMVPFLCMITCAISSANGNWILH